MRIFNELGKAFQVESRRLDHVAVIDRMPDEARKAVLQEIQVPRGPLDVRQDWRIGRAEKIEPLAAHEHRAEIPTESVLMLLAAAVEIDDLPVKAVAACHVYRLLAEDRLRPAG